MSKNTVWMFLFACIFMLGAACNTDKQKTQLNKNSASATTNQKDPNDDLRIKPKDQARMDDDIIETTPPQQMNASTGINYDVPNAFTAGNYLIRCIYQEIDFTLQHGQKMIPITTDQIPWARQEGVAYNNNGIFITYMFNQTKMSIAEPQIRVEYINRSLPYCSSVDSVYKWLDTQVSEQKGSLVIKEIFESETASGKKAYCKEYFRAQGKLSKKYLAYAYIPISDRYIAAFNLTTIEEADFKEYLPMFYELVKSLSFG